jgi:hypothetical protein
LLECLFHHPKKDKCITCERFKNTPDDLKTDAMKAECEKHEIEKFATYREHERDQQERQKNDKILCCSFDLQAVLNTPRGESVLLFYARKYAIYNFTVYESVTRRGNCFVWGESDAHRGASDIATCLFKFLMDVDGRQDGTKHIILYCDCCAGQNRNRTILSMLHYVLSITINIEEITVKFLLPGHSYMPADSIHATIERFTKKRTIWAPSQWSEAIEMARVDPFPYAVTEMKNADFQDWSSFEKKLPRQLLDDDKKKVKWLSVRSLHLLKGQDYVEMKNGFRDDCQTFNVSLTTSRTRRCKNPDASSSPVMAYTSRLPISLPKFNDLKRLCSTGVIPQRFHSEYLSLPVENTVNDCLQETDEEDANEETND